MRRSELSEQMKRGDELMRLNRAAFERNTEAFERNREALERNREAFERVMAALDRHEQAFEENRQMLEENKLFIREMTRRNERVVQGLVRGNQKFWTELRADLKEGRDESRAQTQALLTLIDRLPPPAQAA